VEAVTLAFQAPYHARAATPAMKFLGMATLRAGLTELLRTEEMVMGHGLHSRHGHLRPCWAMP
jgi:hypothetical protein